MTFLVCTVCIILFFLVLTFVDATLGNTGISKAVKEENKEQWCQQKHKRTNEALNVRLEKQTLTEDVELGAWERSEWVKEQGDNQSGGTSEDERGRIE